MPAAPVGLELGDLLGQFLELVPVAVIAAEHDHRHFGQRAAPEHVQRQAGELADRVMQRAVDAGLGAKPDPPVAQERLGRGAGDVPGLLDRHDLAADQLRRHLVGDDAHDGALQFVIAAVEAFADDAGVGVDAGDDGAAVGELQVRADRSAIEPDFQRNGFDAHDAHVGGAGQSRGRGDLGGDRPVHGRGFSERGAPRSAALASTRSFDQWIINALIQNSDARSIHPYTSDFQDRSIEEFERHLLDREPDGLRRSAKASVTNRATASFTSRRKEIGRRVVVKSGHSPS